MEGEHKITLVHPTLTYIGNNRYLSPATLGYYELTIPWSEIEKFDLPKNGEFTPEKVEIIIKVVPKLKK